jgi:5-methylcytosine-specific restriction endonuclease McrA
MKRCADCLQYFPATPEYFNRDKARKDGFNPYCRDCRKARRAVEYAKNPQPAKERASKWYTANHERALAYRRERRATHREQLNREAAEYRERNRDAINSKIRAYKREVYFPANRDKYRVWDLARRARKQQASGAHTAAEINALYERQHGRCAYCGCELNGKYEVDHVIPLSRGGANDATNLALACRTCNRSKGTRLLSEWLPG